jgi:hypothetical protein
MAEEGYAGRLIRCKDCDSLCIVPKPGVVITQAESIPIPEIHEENYPLTVASQGSLSKIEVFDAEWEYSRRKKSRSQLLFALTIPFALIVALFAWLVFNLNQEKEDKRASAHSSSQRKRLEEQPSLPSRIPEQHSEQRNPEPTNAQKEIAIGSPPSNQREEKPSPLPQKEIEVKPPLDANPTKDSQSTLPKVQNEPEGPTAETKSILKLNLDNLASPRPADRAKAAAALGELGEKAMTARRPLCSAMLDVNEKVRVAAADALKKIDPEIQRLAVAIVINKDRTAIQTACQLKENGEPLTPLIMDLAKPLLGVTKGQSDLGLCIQSLAEIAPDDTAVNKLVLTCLISPNAHYRQVSLNVILKMKNKKQAVPQLLQIAKSDTEGLRIKAIQTLLELVDEDNQEKILKVIEGMRFDRSEAVRSAVDRAVEKLRPKK